MESKVELIKEASIAIWRVGKAIFWGSCGFAIAERVVERIKDNKEKKKSDLMKEMFEEID